jgi:hypothetical protein
MIYLPFEKEQREPFFKIAKPFENYLHFGS